MLLGRYLIGKHVGKEMQIATMIHPGWKNDHIDVVSANGLDDAGIRDPLCSIMLRTGYKGEVMKKVMKDDGSLRDIPAGSLCDLLRDSYEVVHDLHGVTFPEGLRASDALAFAAQIARIRRLPIYIGRDPDSLTRIVKWYPGGWKPELNYGAS